MFALTLADKVTINMVLLIVILVVLLIPFARR